MLKLENLIGVRPIFQAMKPHYFYGGISDSDKIKFGIVTTPYEKHNETLSVINNQKSVKILDSEKQPLVRVDYNAHHGQKANHLQYGGNENAFNPDRSGEDAFEILAQIIKKSKNKFNFKF